MRGQAAGHKCPLDLNCVIFGDIPLAQTKSRGQLKGLDGGRNDLRPCFCYLMIELGDNLIQIHKNNSCLFYECIFFHSKNRDLLVFSKKTGYTVK